MSLLLLFGGAAAPVNATASITEADDTLSGSATALIKGTLSASLADSTLSTTGALLIKGTLSATLAAVTLASTAALAIKANAAIVGADDTLTATGTTGANTGRVNAVLANATVSASGQVAQVPIIVGQRGGGSDEQHDYERRQRDWQEDLRRIIDQAWKIANGEIDPATLEPIPPADLASLASALELIEQERDQAVIDAFMAEEAWLQEEEAIALLLLAA
jgi:hypothetical protein